MAGGSVAEAVKNTRVLSFVLLAVIVVCAGFLGLGRPGPTWSVVLQIASAVAGAALGNFLRLDLAAHVVRNQARPATRHLFDHAINLQRMVERADALQTRVQQDHAANVPLDHERVSDWFGTVSDDLRDGITATSTALENWGDLAKDVLDDEFSSYNTRAARLPAANPANGTTGTP